MTYVAAIILIGSGYYWHRVYVGLAHAARANPDPEVAGAWGTVVKVLVWGAVLGQAIIHICRVVAKEVQ